MRAALAGALALGLAWPQAAWGALAGSIKPGGDSPWVWQRTAQLVWSSNILHVGDGPRAAALRLSYQGSSVGRLPRGWGLYRLDIEQQALRFSLAQFNYGGLAASLTLCHGLGGPWWFYEGATSRLRVANALPGANFPESDYYAGLAAVGALWGGKWQVSLSGDRLDGVSLRDAYWGLALRGGYERRFSRMAIVDVQAVAQRLDRLIDAGALYRAFVAWGFESEPGPGARMGVRGTVGAQLGNDPSGWFVEVGPFFRAGF